MHAKPCRAAYCLGPFWSWCFLVVGWFLVQCAGSRCFWGYTALMHLCTTPVFPAYLHMPAGWVLKRPAACLTWTSGMCVCPRLLPCCRMPGEMLTSNMQCTFVAGSQACHHDPCHHDPGQGTAPARPTFPQYEATCTNGSLLLPDGLPCDQAFLQAIDVQYSCFTVHTAAGAWLRLNLASDAGLPCMSYQTATQSRC